jgi:hypothetical protein
MDAACRVSDLNEDLELDSQGEAAARRLRSWRPVELRVKRRVAALHESPEHAGVGVNEEAVE